MYSSDFVECDGSLNTVDIFTPASSTQGLKILKSPSVGATVTASLSEIVKLSLLLLVLAYEVASRFGDANSEFMNMSMARAVCESRGDVGGDGHCICPGVVSNGTHISVLVGPLFRS